MATKRDERREEALKHIGLMKAVFETDTKTAIGNVRIYEDGEGRELDIPEARYETTRTEATSELAVAAAYACRGKVAVLDPISFTRPGGSYADGGFAAEEQLCADSNLYGILEGMKEEYYDKNREYLRGSLYTDRAMYIPGVKFAYNGVARDLDIVAAAPPNRERALERHRAPEECDADLARRIETVMRIAASQGVDSLVACAFGCGFFGNDPAQVAGLFKAWIDEHPGVFETVVFAMFRGPNLDAFENVFGKPQPKVQPVVREEEDEDDEDDDFVDADQRDQGRWTFG